MKKHLKKTLLVLSATTVASLSLAPFIFGPQINFDQNNQPLNQLSATKAINWNDPKNFLKTQELKDSISKTVEEKTDTGDTFKSTNEEAKSRLLLFQNVVNNKYLDYVKLDFKTLLKIKNARTSYNGLFSEKEPEVVSDAITYSAENLNKNDAKPGGKNQKPTYETNNNINKKIDQIKTKDIDYPWKYDRQIMGTVSASTNGFTTEITFNNAANLPLEGSGYIISADKVNDQNGNASSISSADIKVTNLGSTGTEKEGTKLSNYKMVIEKKVTDKLTIQLDSATNHSDMKVDVSITDNSPKPTSSTYNYQPTSGNWLFRLNGSNLSSDANNYTVTINNKDFNGSDLTITGTSQAINIGLNYKLDLPEAPDLKPFLDNVTASIYVKGAWQKIDATGTTNFKLVNQANNNINALAQNGSFDYTDSQKNPAGKGAFQFDATVKTFTKEVINNQVYITLNQDLNYGIKNDIFDFARYKDKGSSQADFISENTMVGTYPQLQPLFDHLTKSVASASKWDNEFYFGETAMKEKFKNGSADVNILFASNSQKKAWLVEFYTKVFQEVFKAQTKSSKYKIDDGKGNKKAAQELFIFEPANWKVNVNVKKDRVDLTFSYTFFDGSEQSFTYPIRTKLFLNNLDKSQDDYNKWDLNVFEKTKPIDVSKVNNENLKYADIYYDLYNNIQGSQSLYNTLFSFKNKEAASADVKILETLFTQEDFHSNLARTNPVNWLDPKRMISFSTTDEENNQYNSWSDLAKGKLKFNLDLGTDLKNFYLADHRAKKTRYTYEFIGFNTQYDIYYNQNSTAKGQQKKPIKVDGFSQKNVETITSDWILDNLIVYDNQSANTAQNRKIATSSHFADNKLMATNLLKNDFVKLVLGGNKNNIRILDRNTTFGTMKVEINLKNIGDLPSSLKAKTLTSKGGTTYNLLSDKSKMSFVFELDGFQKNYDLQYNFAKADRLDATKLKISESVDTITNKITANSNKEFSDKLISFEWYDENKREKDFIEKLLKTRLSKNDFYNLFNDIKITTNESKGEKGINKFSGIYYGSLDFNTNKDEAINHNNSPSEPIEFTTLNTDKIEFALINLQAQMKFYLNPKYHNKKEQDYDYYTIDQLGQYSAKQLANPRFLLKTLNDLQLIDYKLDKLEQTKPSLIQTNALSYEDLIEAYETDVIKFENITKLSEDGILKFDLVLDPHGGSIDSNHSNLGQTTSNSTNSKPLVFKLAFANLKKTISEDEQEDLYTYKLDQVNQILAKNYQYMQQISFNDIINDLIIYRDTPLEKREQIEKILNKKVLEISLTKSELIANLNTSLEGFTSGIRIEETDPRQISLIITIALNKEIQFNGQKTKNIRFKIEDFVGRANLDWKITNQSTISINDYNNSTPITIEDFNEEFILKNMFRFANYPITKKYILDNSYLSLEEFKKQQNIKIQLDKDLANQTIKVQIMTSANHVQSKLNKPDLSYSSLNFIIDGFDQQQFSVWDSPIWRPVIWSAITIGSLGLITLVALIIKKIVKKSNK